MSWKIKEQVILARQNEEEQQNTHRKSEQNTRQASEQNNDSVYIPPNESSIA